MRDVKLDDGNQISAKHAGNQKGWPVAVVLFEARRRQICFECFLDQILRKKCPVNHPIYQVFGTLGFFKFGRGT